MVIFTNSRTIILECLHGANWIRMIIELDQDILSTNILRNFGGNWMRNVLVRDLKPLGSCPSSVFQ